MYQALNATSNTIRQYLQDRIKADSFLNGPTSPWNVRSMSVTLNTPTDMSGNSEEGMSIWLYRVVRDEQRLNDPPIRLSPTQYKAPPLPLRLHYLITPITSRDNAGDPDTEQYLLGKVLQVFHTKPVLLGTDLRGELTGSNTELHMRLETLTVDEITRVWDALEGSYQLSVSYEVGLVNVDSASEPEALAPVKVVLPEYVLSVG